MSATPRVLRQRSRLAAMSGRPAILGQLDTGIHVVALVEIHVNEVVAANDAVQWNRFTVDL